MLKLRITEIFCSIQGEGTTVGRPTVFVRLSGCPLRCSYCDTKYAFKGGKQVLLDEILTLVADFNINYVTVTGGEPLAQKECLLLLKNLCYNNYKVSLETSGAYDISNVASCVIKVLDIKTPASGEMNKNLWGNISYLKLQDQAKFVICNRIDYEWAKKKIKKYHLTKKCEVLFSPCTGRINPTDLANWMLNDRLNVRFQIQLHKILWGERPGV